MASPLPAKLLSSQELQAACAEHNFAEVFRLLNRRAGLSQAAIAAASGLSSSRVSDVMRGRRGLRSVETIARISDAFRIPGAMLGIDSSPWENGDGNPDDPGDPVKRREFLASTVGATGAYVASLLASEPHAMNSVLAASRRPPAQLQYLESTADLLGSEVIRVTPTDLLETALITFKNARTLIVECSKESDRSRLIQANAKLATVVGHILFDTNRFDAAREWFLTARHAATEAGDHYLADIALAEHVYLPTYSDDPQGVLSLAETRLDKKSSDTPAIAWLWAYCGKAHAVLGDANKAQRALDRSENVLSNSAPESLKAGIFSFLPEKLQMYRAQAFVSLNQPEMAVAAAEHALSLYNLNETTEPSLARFARASALLQAGEIDEACRCAIEAVTGSSVYINVAIQQRAKSFTNEIPDTRSPAAREWRDALLTTAV